MNIIAITYLASAFIAFESAITVSRLNRRSPVNRVYFIFVIDYMLFSVLFSQFLTAPSREMCRIWSMLATPPLILLPALVIHFFIYLARPGNRVPVKFFIILMYSIVIVFIERSSRGIIITDHVMTPWGWDNVFSDSLWTLLTGVYAFLSPFVCGYLVFRWKNSTGNELERKQAGIVMYSTIPGGFGILSCLIFALTDNPLIVTFMSDLLFAFLFTGFILGVRYAIIRYKLMNLSEVTPLTGIISGFDDPAFLVSKNGKIIFSNDMAKSLAGNSPGKQSSVRELFSCGDEIEKEISEMLAGSRGDALIDCVYVKTGDDHMSSKLHMRAVRDEIGQLTGVILVVVKDHTLNDFIKNYRITGRQFEIISLVAAGCSNREISERLELSERTVENHLFNIYNKLGIGNKIELLNALARFNVSAGNT